ncbi:hypothetical protein [Lysinibacillus xylanilyticus]|uniref:Uncharacterized protein n=1 Tax=Lysinibacillus xylanilyticus TaxID=582475 RepID=A0ABT4EMB1_9BACI|nr:hypothetical protein [Lysinibacillus xylanilyticus]MCY9546761.1 hypothetical protein [Lysinibacillus xylanilyticus]
MTKLRIEVVLTEADADIIEFIQSSSVPRATQFKLAMREKMQRREEEKFDTRVKRLLDEVLAQRGVSNPVINEVKPSKRLGFGGKRLYDDEGDRK